MVIDEDMGMALCSGSKQEIKEGLEIDCIHFTLVGNKQYLKLSKTVVLHLVDSLPRRNACGNAEYDRELILSGSRTPLFDFYKLDLNGGLGFYKQLKL